MTRRQRDTRLRRLLLAMQATLYARRCAWRMGWPPLVALALDTRLRLAGAAIVDEMRRVEGATTGDAA